LTLETESDVERDHINKLFHAQFLETILPSIAVIVPRLEVRLDATAQRFRSMSVSMPILATMRTGARLHRFIESFILHINFSVPIEETPKRATSQSPS
jgi:hypothetical protein